MVFRSTSRQHVLTLVTTLIVTLGFTLLIEAAPAHAADSTLAAAHSKSKAPARVTGLKAVDKTSSRGAAVRLTWKKAARAQTYQVQYKKASSKRWSSFDQICSTKATIRKLDGGRKYIFRVRGIRSSAKGSGANSESIIKGKWSKAVSIRTRSVKPSAPVTVWPTYLDDSRISVAWPGVSNATSYQVTCMEHTHKIGTVTTKNAEATFTGLEPGIGYQITVRSKNGSKRSTRSAYLATGTMEDDNVLAMHEPTSIYYTLTRFKQYDGAIPGSEYLIPALFAYHYDSEGDLSSDSGFFFPKYVDLQEATIHDATKTQYNAADVAHPLHEEITESTTLRVGDTFTDLRGKESTITNLRLTIDYDQDRLRDCTSMEETYDYIDTFQVEVQTVDGVLYPVYIEYPWH